MRLKKQSGFSLVELVIVMGFSLAILASIYGFFRAQTHTTKGQESRMEAHEYAMAVLDSMVREIRNTGYFPNNGTPCTNIANTAGIVAASADSFRLVYDTNNDGVCDQDVSFTYDGTNKNILRNGTELTDGNATAVTFAYYPQQTSGTAPSPYCISAGVPSGCSGTLASNLSSVQKIAISVTVQAKSKDTKYGGLTNITMNSTAELRNHGL
ncbi:MAG TPA: type II secretion system protein [Candidatus Binatia bacterium]|jgi:type II secretory pathway pseudopilin PulG